ncbi:BHLH domain-containing protein [Psidium guajava]|nr:BHLH domain-containing protein [Psidium guajava]
MTTLYLESTPTSHPSATWFTGSNIHASKKLVSGLEGQLASVLVVASARELAEGLSCARVEDWPSIQRRGAAPSAGDTTEGNKKRKKCGCCLGQFRLGLGSFFLAGRRQLGLIFCGPKARLLPEIKRPATNWVGSAPWGRALCAASSSRVGLDRNSSMSPEWLYSFKPSSW